MVIKYTLVIVHFMLRACVASYNIIMEASHVEDIDFNFSL